MTITFQPARRNFRRFSLSLFALRCSFATQYLRLLDGTRHIGHLCKCQKQPLTLMTFINRGNTRSGLPGKERTCRRRTTSSGVVSFDFTAAMMRERSDFVNVSVIRVLWENCFDFGSKHLVWYDSCNQDGPARCQAIAPVS